MGVGCDNPFRHITPMESDKNSRPNTRIYFPPRRIREWEFLNKLDPSSNLDRANSRNFCEGIQGNLIFTILVLNVSRKLIGRWSPMKTLLREYRPMGQEFYFSSPWCYIHIIYFLTVRKGKCRNAP
jgi:hypothetical protein